MEDIKNIVLPDNYVKEIAKSFTLSSTFNINEFDYYNNLISQTIEKIIKEEELKMKKFKVGDTVKIIDASYSNFCENDIGVIIENDNSSCPYKVKRAIDGETQWFHENQITLQEYTWEDFKKCPIGTKITFEDGVMLVKTGDNRFESQICQRPYEMLLNFKDNNVCAKRGKIIKIEEPTSYITVYEPKEEIKEMTLADVCKELGYEIKLIKEDK